MPDPKLKLPVSVAQKGDVYVVVDGGGDKVAGTDEYDTSDAAQEVADRINESWNRAKAERKSKGAPEITREALEEAIQEAALDAKERKKLPKSAFAIPEDEAYPIHDEAHARNALARVAQHGSPEEKKRVRAAVKRRYPKMVQEAAFVEAELQEAVERRQQAAEAGDSREFYRALARERRLRDAAQKGR